MERTVLDTSLTLICSYMTRQPCCCNAETSLDVQSESVDEGSVFVVDLTAKLKQKVFASRCPHRGDEKLLTGANLNPAAFTRAYSSGARRLME